MPTENPLQKDRSVNQWQLRQNTQLGLNAGGLELNKLHEFDFAARVLHTVAVAPHGQELLSHLDQLSSHRINVLAADAIWA